MLALRILVNLFNKCLLNEFAFLSKVGLVGLFIDIFIEYLLYTKQCAKFWSCVAPSLLSWKLEFGWGGRS